MSFFCLYAKIILVCLDKTENIKSDKNDATVTLSHVFFTHIEMKFGEYLRANLTSEWITQYISYDEMKEFLVEVLNNAPASVNTEEDTARSEHFQVADEDFFQVNQIFRFERLDHRSVFLVL